MLVLEKNKIKLKHKTIFRHSDKAIVEEVYLRLLAHYQRYRELGLAELLEDIKEELL